jgi:hypothetical protein
MNNINMIKRESCTVCECLKLNFLLETPKLPAFQGCISAPSIDDVKVAQEWMSCPCCGTIQLAYLLPLSLVYGKGHAESFGKLWNSHHSDFSKFILKNSINAVCEIGGGIGKLAQAFRNNGGKSNWYNLDPNPSCNNIGKISDYEEIKGFFDEDFLMPKDVDTLVFSHCLEHMYDLSYMIKLLAKKLKSSDKLIVSWPIIESWLSSGLPGALNWEHTFFCTVATLKTMLANNGFKILYEEIFHTNHSIFLALEKLPNLIPQFNVNELQNIAEAENRSLVANYFANFEIQANLLKEILLSTPKPFWLMPASIYSQYLFAFGLHELSFNGVLDNSENKKNLRLYGTPLYVYSPSELQIDVMGSIVLNGGAHTPEIKQQLKITNPNLIIVNI